MDRTDRMHHGAAAGGPPYSRGAPPPAVRSAPEQGRGTGGYGGPPPGATSPHGARPGTGTGHGGRGGGSRSKRGLGLAAATVLLVGIAGGAWWALTAPEASATQVSLETVASSGSLPFGAPAANDAVGVVAPANAGGQLAGNTAGLYARPAGAPPCDGAAIVSQVTGDPAKAAAWAAPLGIGAGDIPAFVGGLSPLALRADTAVTQYGYADGQFQPYPAVLQAGTAVLVNSFGEPTVKCYNANPLGAPTSSNTDGELAGAPWPGFSIEQTVTVVAASAAQSRLVVVDGGSNTQQPTEVPPQTVPPKKNPGAPTDGQGKLLLTGVHNYDGTITLSDGRIMRADGSIVKPTVTVEHPKGSTTLKDGGIQHPDGRVFNVDGTERRPIVFQPMVGAAPNQIPVGPPRTINPDGTTVPPLPAGSVVWNHDGSFMIVEPGTPGSVKIVDQKGVEHPPAPPFPAGSSVNADGSVTTKDGKVLYPTGQERPPKVVIPPGDVVLDPKGGNTPPIEQKAADEKDTLAGAKVQIGNAPGGGVVVQKDKDGQLVPVPEQSVVCAQAPCDPAAGQGAPGAPGAPGIPGAPGGPVVPGPVDGNGAPVVVAPGDKDGTTAPDCATAPAGTAGCGKAPAKPEEPAPGTGLGTAGSGGTTTGGDGSGGAAGSGGSGESGGGSSSSGGGSGGGSSGGESGSGN